jgi:hypothetical protein
VRLVAERHVRELDPALARVERDRVGCVGDLGARVEDLEDPGRRGQRPGEPVVEAGQELEWPVDQPQVADVRLQAANGQPLVLNGLGLNEKLWFDIYVGSLYLTSKSRDVAEILSRPAPWRVQLDFIYTEVASEKLLEAWREGFESNQNAETLEILKPRIEQFYSYFSSAVVAKDEYQFDYIPGQGTQIRKNRQIVGLIPGKDFKNALLEIWLGNHPVDKNLKRSMLGIW